MAFALALQSVHDLPEGHGQTIFTATTAIVVLTVGLPNFSFLNYCVLTYEVLVLMHASVAFLYKYY